MNNLILYEDDQLLAIHKPSGINTHQPDRYAPEGIHEWLVRCHCRPLSILHRLDKDTSGVLLFGKTRQANQSLTQQFTAHTLRKTYLLLSDRRPTRVHFQAHSPGAETDFEYGQPLGDCHLIVARPLTGKTHQVRRHAAENGFPVLGDVEYEGGPAPRMMLHAYAIEFDHPATGQRLRLEASVPDAFEQRDALTAASEFRRDLFADATTNCYRLISGTADGFPDAVVDWYNGYGLVQWQREVPDQERLAFHERLRETTRVQWIYEQLVTRQARGKPQRAKTHPRPVPGGESGTGSPPPEVEDPELVERGVGVGAVPGGHDSRVLVRENGLQYLIRFDEGLGTGLFLDQRENRSRLRQLKLAGQSVLNCFAYTCAFSVVAAAASARTTSLDLSRHYLDWGRENFRANGLNPDDHEFIHGDVFDWLKRFAKRGRRWNAVLLDPPTFSTTKTGRRFQAERDYGELIGLAVAILDREGWLFCSTNQRTFAPQTFEETVRETITAAGRTTASLEYATQPFDFRVAAGERPYLKTCWVRLAD